MASVFVLLEAFNRKEAAALGFFPCATASFSCFGCSWAELTIFTVYRWSMHPCRSSPARKARGSNPPGRTKSSTLWGAALFILHGFYGAVKERIRTARAPRLGEFLRAYRKTLLRCIFCNEVFLF